jgi:hypothetical protein
MWRLPWTSGYSYPRVTTIRIDVHPTGKDLINMTQAFHGRSAYGHRPYVPHVVRVCQPFTSPQHGWTDALLLRKSAPDSTSQLGRVAHGNCLSFSPNTAIEVVHLSQALVDARPLGLLGPYHQYAIGTFNTCSWEPTHQSLTGTCGGYSLKGAGLPHHTTPPNLPNCRFSTFHLRACPISGYPIST